MCCVIYSFCACSRGCQPFTWTFPRADIYELILPDLLHQVIKGTFKDHLVTWVGQYLEAMHTKKKAAQIMADIDRRYLTSFTSQVNLTVSPASRQHLPSLDSTASLKAETSNSGRGMIPRH